MKAGRGRPSLGSQGRSVVVSVKFSQDEIAALTEAAVASGVTLSKWIRDHAIAPLGLVRAVDISDEE